MNDMWDQLDDIWDPLVREQRKRGKAAARLGYAGAIGKKESQLGLLHARAKRKRAGSIRPRHARKGKRVGAGRLRKWKGPLDLASERTARFGLQRQRATGAAGFG